MYVKVVLSVIAVCLLVLAVPIIVERGVGPEPAYAMDPGLQRVEMIQELRKMNQTIERIVRIIEQGRIKVQVIE